MVDMQHEYLGDGVYASFDGYHIVLRTGSHEGAPLVALEPEVMAALKRYEQRVLAAASNKEEVSG